MDNQQNHQPPKWAPSFPKRFNAVRAPRPGGFTTSQGYLIYPPAGYPQPMAPQPHNLGTAHREYYRAVQTPQDGTGARFNAPPRQKVCMPKPIQRPPSFPRPILGKRYNAPVPEQSSYRVLENPPNLRHQVTSDLSFASTPSNGGGFSPMVTSTPIQKKPTQEYTPPVLAPEPDLHCIVQSWRIESGAYLSLIDYLQNRATELDNNLQNLRYGLHCLAQTNRNRVDQLIKIDEHFQQIVRHPSEGQFR